MKKITFIADPHNKFKQLNGLLPGGDIIICAGDMTGMGYMQEIENFCEWYDGLYMYDNKVFIAGNHDWGFQDHPEKIKKLLKAYPKLDYLQDDLLIVGEDYEKGIKIWGTPWQPEFYNWAFNLPRGKALKEKWDLIPNDIDILVTHGPPFGKLDYVAQMNVGCEELDKKVKEIKPKICVFGHIHEAYGYVFDGNTHYFNAAVVNHRCNVVNKPLTVLWDKETNEIEFV